MGAGVTFVSLFALNAAQVQHLTVRKRQHQFTGGIDLHSGNTGTVLSVRTVCTVFTINTVYAVFTGGTGISFITFFALDGA